jgi:protein SCO1
MKSRWAVALVLTAWVAVLATSVRPVTADASKWGANYFPNLALTTQDGETVHFYDLIKGKIVAIDLIYTTCEYNCPLETARLAQVQKLLGDRVGKDVLFVSITIDPEHDTPAVLKEYAAKYHTGPGWVFLTGKLADIDLLSKKLGLYTEPNPDNKDGHTPTLLIGNEATGQWLPGSALDNAKFTAMLIGDLMSNWTNSNRIVQRSYAEAKALRTPSRGEYLFATKCSSCHAIGTGQKIGPDLAGISGVRDRKWLARYISVPEEVLAAGDPIARALLARYQTRMPNLSLTEAEGAAIIDYIDEVTTESRSATKFEPKSK